MMTWGGFTLLAAGLAWSTMWLLGKTDANDGAGIANVLALPATVLGSVVAAIGLRSRPRSDDPDVLASCARNLLRRVVVADGRALQQLLGDMGDTHPANIGFTRPEIASVNWRADAGATKGSLATIAPYYNSLDRGRLVVLGDPGAGKSVLAIKLLLDLADIASHVAPDTKILVPIRLNLSTFPHRDESNSTATRDRVDKWIIRHLIDNYYTESSTATLLVSNGWILPIFDGLDEMDSESVDLVRARAFTAALNVFAGRDRWPIVVTCRRDRYLKLVDSESATGVQDATVISIDSLKVEQIIEWLRHRFPDKSQSDGIHRRWQPVLARIRRNPTGRLANCLANPLKLYLAVTVYRQRDSKPGELCILTTSKLNHHLYAHLIPAICHQQHHKRKSYDPIRTERWMHTFARHLELLGKDGNPATDIHLYDLWRTTGNTRSRGRSIKLRAAILGTLTIALVVLMLRTRLFNKPAFLDISPLYRMLDVSIVLAVFIAIFIRLYSSAELTTLQRLDIRLARTRKGLKNVSIQAAPVSFFGFIVGAGVGVHVVVDALHGTSNVLSDAGIGRIIIIGALTAFSVGLFVAVVATFTLGIPVSVIGINVQQESTPYPSAPMRQATRRDLSIVFASGLALAIVGRLSNDSIYMGLAGMAAGALLIGVFGNGILRELPRYLLTVYQLSRDGNLPPRPGKFLDWAHEVGLIRLSGIAAQFRHRELQAWLTVRQLPDSNIDDQKH